jgi:hypothetical protein
LFFPDGFSFSDLLSSSEGLIKMADEVSAFIIVGEGTVFVFPLSFSGYLQYLTVGCFGLSG